MTLCTVSDLPDFLEKSPHEKKVAAMNEEAARYENSGTRQVCVPRPNGRRSCHGRVRLTAFMPYQEGHEGVILMEVFENRKKLLYAAGEGPSLFLSYEEGWTLENASFDEMSKMADSLVQQLETLDIRAQPAHMISLVRQLGENRKVTRLAEFFKTDPGDLPSDFSSVVWHPSAGKDFTPIVAYSKGYLGGQEALADLTPATLHVMTCLGGYEEPLMNYLKSEDRVLFEDHQTRVRIASYEMLELKNERLWSRPSRRNYNLGGRETIFSEQDSDGFIARVEILCKKTGYLEEVPVLYLLSENIATYEEFVRSGLFQVRHIKATCEGLAFGGCSRSLIDYICESQWGLNTLESSWLRDGCGEYRFQNLPDAWQIKVGRMPRAFSGELVRVSRKEGIHV